MQTAQISPPQMMKDRESPIQPQAQSIMKSEPVPVPVIQQPQPVVQPSVNSSNRSLMFQYAHNDSSSNLLNSTLNIPRNTLTQRQTTQARYSKKQKVKDYVKRETSKFFGVDTLSQETEKLKWNERQKRLAIRCFGQLREDSDEIGSPR
jgi:hypothetical protein